MYPVNAQILGEGEVFGGWKREGDVLFRWRGKDRCVKIFCQGDGRVAGFWKRYGGRYEAVEVRGLPRYLKGEVKEVVRMLEGGYVRFLRDCVEVRARGAGGMMKGEGEEEVDFDKLLEEIEDVEKRKVVQRAVKTLLKNDPEGKELSIEGEQIGAAGVQVLERKAKSVPILNAPSISKFGQLSSDRFFAVDKKLFNQIEEKLFSAKSAEEKTRVVVLRGDPGVGKAELATEFSILNFANYSVVWGFDAQSEEALNNSYRELADRFGLTNKSENISTASIRNQINVHLEKKTPWLLVFTNVDERESFFLNREQWFPKCGGCVLIVSKENSWQRIPENNVIEVPKLYRDESIELLKRFMPLALQEQYAQLDTLAEKLECVPLALMQAGNFIRERSVSQKDYRINTYLEAFNKKRAATRGLANHLAIVITTWQVTMDYMQKNHPIAYEALHLFAYLNSEDIPLEWVASWLKINGKIEDVEKTVHQIIVPLTAYRMIGYVEERKILRIQPLLQQVVRNNQTGALRREIIGQALDLVLEKFVSYENLPHAVKIVNFVNGERKKQQYLEKTAALLSKMAEYIQRQGDTLLAKKYYEQLLDIYRIIYDKSAIQVADVLKKLGDLLLTLKENENANECFDQYLNIYQAYYGQYSLEMAIALQNIGKKREAIETYTHILQACYRKEAQYSEQEILERLVNIFPIHLEAETGSLSLDLSGYGNLGNEVMIAVVKHFSNLTSLNLSGWCSLRDEDVEKIIHVCTNLQELDISGCYKFTDEAIRLIIKECTNLQKLNLSRCSQLTNAAFGQEGNYSKLLSWHLEGCKNLTDVSLAVIIPQCSKLQELTLSECIQLESKTFQLISKLQELKILKLNKCENLREEDVEMIIDQIKNRLQTLELSGCKKLRDIIFKNCLALKVIDLSENNKLAEITFDNCPELKQLNLAKSYNLKSVILDECGTLPSLNINTCERLKNVYLCGCKKLTELSLAGAIKLDNLIFEDSPLVSLNLSGCHNLPNETFEVIKEDCEEVTILELSECKNLEEETLNSLLEKCGEKLKTLRLSQCDNLKEVALEKCTNLQELDVSECVKLSENTLKKIQGKQLVSLNLKECKNLSDETIYTLILSASVKTLQRLVLRECVNLKNISFELCEVMKTLDLSGCCSLSNETLQTINGTELQSLRLRRCHNLSEKTVKTIISNCPKLQKLDLRLCRNFTDLIIKNLRATYPAITFQWW